MRDIPSDEEVSDTEDPDLLVSLWDFLNLFEWEWYRIIC